jgi:hypothetical protein
MAPRSDAEDHQSRSDRSGLPRLSLSNYIARRLTVGARALARGENDVRWVLDLPPTHVQHKRDLKLKEVRDSLIDNETVSDFHEGRVIVSTFRIRWPGLPTFGSKPTAAFSFPSRDFLKDYSRFYFLLRA